MPRRHTVALLLALASLTIVAAPAQAHWPRDTKHVTSGLEARNVGGWCGRLDLWSCIHIRTSWTHRRPKCQPVDYNRDGHVRFGWHGYEIRCLWRERAVVIMDNWECDMVFYSSTHYDNHVGQAFRRMRCWNI